jgi:MFS family permease
MNGLREGRLRSTIAYLTAAVLLRCLDAGATVGILLIALSHPQLHGAVRLGAVLGAALTLPHVLAPWTARVVARFPHPRLVIPAAGLWLAGLLAVLACGIGRLPVVVLLLLAVAAGIVGPVLTGGLSSHASSALGPGRSATSLDALTYGVAGTASPAVITVFAGQFGPVAAVLGMAALSVLGSLAALTLPRIPEQHTEAAEVSAHPLKLLLSDPGLRMVAVLTWLGAFIVAAALVIGIATVQGQTPALSGHVATALGVGGLIGAALLIWRTPRQDPRRGILVTTALLAGGCAVAGLITVTGAVLAVFLILGMLNSTQTVFSLAAREELSPPQLRQQVFISLAGTKVAFSSAGTAAAGLLATAGSHLPLLGLAALGLLTCAVLVVTGRRTTDTPAPTTVERQPVPAPRS